MNIRTDTMSMPQEKKGNPFLDFALTLASLFPPTAPYAMAVRAAMGSSLQGGMTPGPQRASPPMMGGQGGFDPLQGQFNPYGGGLGGAQQQLSTAPTAAENWFDNSEQEQRQFGPEMFNPMSQYGRWG